jgi:3-deoxy-D-manno-octulosonic-acid transferase
MCFIYNILLTLGFILCAPIILIFAAFNLFNVRERLALAEPDIIDSRQSIWLHGASLGEIGIIKKILPALKEKYPHHPLVVSAITRSGIQSIQHDMKGFISHALYLPAEIKWSVRKMLALIKPAIIVITETELWPNFILEAKKYGARIVLINGRVSDRSFPKYLLLKNLFKKILSAFHAIGVQNREYYRRFIKLGADASRLSVTGNIKASIKLREVDSAFKRSLKQSLCLNDEDKVFIAASTRPGEEEIILSAYERLKHVFPRLSIILAPRHPKRTPEIEMILKRRKLSYNKKSSLRGPSRTQQILILDTLGELSMLFAMADIAFIGGTLKPFGGHNLLEPLPFLVPICFGPYCETQKESVKLIKANQCGEEVEDAEEIFNYIHKALKDKNFYNNLVHNILHLLQQSDVRLKANINLI